MVLRLRQTDILELIIDLFENNDISSPELINELMIKLNLKVPVDFSIDPSSDDNKKRIVLWNNSNTDYKIRIDVWKI